MISTKSRITQGKLDQALTDIQQNISISRDWQLALKHLSSIKDYSMGEERFCSSEEALEYCALIKSYFPPATPETVLRNMDAIADEIRFLQQGEAPDFLKFSLHILVVIGFAAAVYWFIFLQ